MRAPAPFPVRAASVFAAVLLLAGAVGGCRRSESADAKGEDAGGKKGAAEAATPDAPTPVTVAAASRRTLAQVVTAPGHTAALSQQKVRAPFAGLLVDLRVSDGDQVRKGETVGAVVSRESEAALSGAREMLREARTPAERADAERAVALAERNLVRKPLLATADGPILSHAAAKGDRVSEDQDVLTIEDASSVVFLVDVPQSDLAAVRAGQAVTVEIAGRGRTLAGRVHSVLPGANAADYTGSVRIDLPTSAERLPLGLFGSARITVGQRENAVVVPDAAVLRDDVSGTSKVATVANGRLHWVPVQPGLRQDGVTEIAGGGLADGATVIVAGMVGLPEGKSVQSAAAPGR